MAKVKNHEEAVAILEANKETLKESRTALRTFKTENGIKRGKEPEDAKVKKGLTAAEGKVTKAQEVLDAAKEVEKELRPKKDRVTKYDYPEGMSDKDKKKFRAKSRRDAKAAAKKAAGGDEEKASTDNKATPEKKVIKKKPTKKNVQED